MESGEKEDIQPDIDCGTQNACLRIEPYIAAGSRKLAARGVKIGRNDIEAYKDRIPVRIGDQIEQRVQCQKSRGAKRGDDDTERIDGAAIGDFIHPESDHGVGNTGGRDGDEQIRKLHHVVHDAVFRCRQHARIERRQEEHQQLRPERTQRDQCRIRH